MLKIRSMMRETRKAILREAEALLRTGALDLEGADNDFRLPKMVLYVAMCTAAEEWRPLSWTRVDGKAK